MKAASTCLQPTVDTDVKRSGNPLASIKIAVAKITNIIDITDVCLEKSYLWAWCLACDTRASTENAKRRCIIMTNYDTPSFSSGNIIQDE